ncbi:MAG: 50S ribosomal protein L10 [Syntrophomonadaceae bacterium]|nr:50S ribosomal protein L10 [Syntrophomonadaceae bacterium]
MNKQRQKKELAVAELRQQLRESTAAVLTDYRGLNVKAITNLRVELRQVGIEYKVVKNTLTQLAAEELGLKGLDPYLEGPTAIAFGKKDPVAPAKILLNFAKTNKQLQIKAGLLQGRVIDSDGVKALADLPSREELLAKVVGGMKAPMYGLVNVLSAPMRNLVCVLEAVRKQKEEQAAS